MTDDCPFCRRPMEPDAKIRSKPQHDRYFAMIDLAYQHWPETHETQFVNSEECRKHLQMKAGWYDVALRFPLAGMTEDAAKAFAKAIIDVSKEYSIPVIEGNTIIVYTPKSIAFRKMDHRTACALFDKVSHVLQTEIGVSGDDLLNNADAI